MKKAMIFTLILMMSVSFISSTLAGNDNEKSTNPLSVKAAGAGKYSLTYTSKVEEKVVVEIFDMHGKRVQADHLKNDIGFQKTYDMTQLPEGKYEVKLKGRSKSYTATINHVKEAKPFFKALIKEEEGKNRYSLTVITHDPKPVRVSIYGAKNKLLYTELIDVDQSFQRVYDLKKQASHAKYISISCGDNNVSYSLN